MSAYVELLTEDMATTESHQVALLKQALDHANNAQTLLGVSHSKDLAQSAAAVKDLVNYFNELYIIKVNSGKIGKTVDENWVRLIKNMAVLRNDIYTKTIRLKIIPLRMCMIICFIIIQHLKTLRIQSLTL